MSGILTCVLRAFRNLARSSRALGLGSFSLAPYPARVLQVASIQRAANDERKEWRRHTAGWALFGLAAALLLGPAALEAGSLVRTGDTNNGAMAIGYPHQRKLVRDASGYWYAVWMEEDGATATYDILFAKSNDTEGTSWATPAKIAGNAGLVYSSNDCRYPALDIDRTNGRIHLVFMDVQSAGYSTNYLYYTRLSDLSNWSVAAGWTQVDGGTSPGRYDLITNYANIGGDASLGASIALDASGNPHVALMADPVGMSFDYWPYYAYGNSGTGTWSTTKVSVSSASMETRFPTVEVTSGGYVHVIWNEYYTGSSRWEYVYHRYTTDFTNFYPAYDNTVVNISGDHLTYLSAAADGEGRIHVTCQDSYDSDICGAYSTNNGTSWTERENIDIAGWAMPAVGVRLDSGITTDLIVSPDVGADPKDIWYWKGGDPWAAAEVHTNEFSDQGVISLEKKVASAAPSYGFLYYDYVSSSSSSIHLGQVYLVDLVLAGQSSGQVTDQIGAVNSVNDANLFRFALKNTTASTITVDQIVFQLTEVVGISNADLSDLRIHDGTSDVSVGGTPSIASGTGTITFTGNFSVPASSTVNYTLIGDIVTPIGGDRITFGLGTSNIALVSGTKGGFSPVSATHSRDYPYSYQVTAGNDDAYTDASTDTVSSAQRTSTSIYLYRSTSAGSRYNAGIRFQNATIPQGSIINRAELQAYSRYDTTDDIYCTIYGEKSNNSQDFSTNPKIQTEANRPRTTASSVVWQQANMGIGWETKDVTAVVQEVVNQGTWEAGNKALTLLFISDSGSSAGIYFRSFDSGSSYPVLYVDYTLPNTVIIGDHSGGQAADALDGNLSRNDVDLYKFSLFNTDASTVTVDQIVFNLSAVSGIATGDLSDLRIWNGSSYVLAGGAPNISAGTGTITFTTDWTIPAASTVHYTLRGDVANLVKDDTLTLSLVPAGVTLVSGDVGGSVSATATHTTDHAATLAEHGSGPLTDQLDGTPTQGDKNLFRFRLVNATVSDLTVDQVVLQLSSVTGIADTDLSDLRISNGTIDVSSGGGASIAAGSGTITFSGNFTLSSGATVDYTVLGDVAGIVKNDTLTVGLGAANVTLAAGVVGGTAPTGVTHTGDDAATLGNHASGQITDRFDSATAKDNAVLFRFQLVNTTAVDLTVDQVQFQLSAINGIATSDLSDLRIHNGTLDVATGGTASISNPTGTITFTGDFTLPASGTVDYALLGDVANLVPSKATPDTITVGLGTANVTLAGGSVGGSAATNAAHTTNYPEPSASADDSYVYETNDNATTNLPATTIRVTSYTGTAPVAQRYHGGFRFPGVYVPKGSTAVNATLYAYVDSETNDPNLDVRGHLVADAPDFATNTYIYNTTQRIPTSASTSWTSNTGTGWKTLNVSTIVQELVTQAVWQSGNAMALLFKPRSTLSGYTVYLRSWDNGDHSFAPYLVITYTPPTTLVLGNHASGQATDQFDGSLAQNDKDLYRFRIENTTGAPVTVDQIIFNLSAVNGIATGDLSDLRIHDGTSDVATGGTPDISGATGTIAFTADWTIPAGATRDYTLRGDAASLAKDDTLTISLSSSAITPVSGDVGGSVSATATHTVDYAASLAEHGGGQLTDQLDGTPTQNDRDLFRFRLVNPTATDLTVDQVVLALSAVAGIADTDLADLRIHNGAINVSTGGVASIAAGSGTISFTGDFNLPAGTTVDYTVIGDVANIVKNDTLTIALGTGSVSLAAGVLGGVAPTNPTHTGDDAATLGNHTSGQVGDQFDSATAKDDAALFRFRLVNATAVDLTVDQVQLQLSAVAGIVTSDLGDLRLNNGTSDVVTGGTPNIAGATGTITFTGDFTLPASGTVDYTLLGDGANLAVGDTLTIALGTANVTLLAGSLGGSAPTAATHTTNVPTVSASADDSYAQESTDNASGNIGLPSITAQAYVTTRYHAGFRFPGIYVPKGSTVSSATLSVYVDGNDDPQLRIFGNLVANAPDLSLGGNVQVFGRARTTSNTVWRTTNVGAGWKNLDVAAVVNEVVNQASWASGNALALMMIADATVGPLYTVQFRSWDYDTPHTYAATLTIGFTPPTTLVLGNHASGQATDQFDGGVSQDDKDLYRFRIENTTGAAVTVDQIIFNLSAINGVANGDLADLRIHDGTSDVVTGGTPDISGATGTIAFTTDWTIPAGATRNYSLRADAANLVKDDTLTISLASPGITLLSGDVGGSVSSTATHTADHTVLLAQHLSGQLTDQLDGSPSRTGVPLYRFRLTNNSQAIVTVDQVVLPLTGVAGVVNGDVSGLRIHDGTTDVSVGGTPLISGATGALTFDADFTLAAAVTVDYTVYADLANLVKDDTLTLALGTGNVSLAAGSVSGSAPSNAAHAVDYSLLLAQHGSGQMTDQFDSSTAKTGVSLFRFQVQNTTPVPITVTQVQFPLSAVSGIAAGDTASMVLFNGAVNVGGTGVVSIGAGTGTITFSSSFAIPASTTVSYTLTGDVANLYAGDTVTIALGLANVTLQAGTIGGTSPTSALHTADPAAFQVAASADDSFANASADNASGSNLTQAYVSVRRYTESSASKLNGGLRFAGVTVPQGALINGATLSGYVYGSNDDIYCTVFGHAVDNAPNFSTDPTIKARSRTTASAAWQVGNVAEPVWVDRDVTAIVQEIVDRAGWASGNALGLLLISDTNYDFVNDYAYFRSYDGAPAQAARLTIDYSPPFLVKSHPSGQLADQLDGAPSRDDAPVFRFQVFNGTGNDITIDQVVFPLSGIAGVVGTDLTDLKVHDESGFVGGVGAASITGATGTITFSGDFTVVAGQTKNYTLYADLANLVKNDTLTVSLAPGNVTVLAGDVGGVSPASATHLVDHTLLLGAHASGQVTDQLDGGLSQAGIDLFRFQLDSDSLSDTTVNQVAVQLSAVTGIVAGDLANLRLYNGTADVGGTPAVSIAAGTGTITFSTPFAVTANAVVNYRLIGDVANLASSDTLTLALGTANVTLAAGTVGGTAPTNAVHTADPTVLLGSHLSGQIADQLDGSLSQTGKTLFRFRLTNNSTSGKTVDQLAFQLSSVTGIASGDLSSLRVWNGSADVGGAASVSIAAGTGTITFSAPFPIAGSTTVDYELIGDAAALVAGDTVTLALGTADVTLAAGTTGGTPPANATHTADHTALLAQHASGQVADQWDTQATQTGKTLFRFRLSNNSGSTITVDQVQLQLAPVVGIVSGDLSSLKITDGAVDVSTGGTPSIAGATGTITFAADFTLAAGQTKDYLVVGSAGNLEPLDAITVALGTANVTLAAGSVGGTAPSSIMHRTDPPSVDGEITDTNDDAWEDPGSSPDVTYRTNPALTVTTSTNALSRAHAGFRFQNLQVLKDAVVNRAVLSVYLTDVANDHLIATVHGDDTSASPSFASTIDINASDNTPLRTLTTAATAIDQPNYGAGWKRIDVTAIAQELVTRPDWAPGSPMTFLMLGGSVFSSVGATAALEDYSAAGTNHARLAIDFNNAALIGSHRWGQVADQFEATTGVFDRPLFQFQLRNVKGTTINIGPVVFQLTGVVGITNSDVANLRLNNGTADLGTCSASISGATGTITCTPGIAIATDGIRHLTLLGDVFNLLPPSTMTISLAPTDVVVAEGPVGRYLPLAPAVTHAWGARSPMVGYSDYAASGPRPLRFSSFEGNVWTLAANAVNGPFDTQGQTGPWPLYWKTNLTQPGLGKQVVLFHEQDADKAALWGSVWNGTAWDDGSGSPYNDAHEVAGYGVDPGMLWNNLKHWDAAYEQLSGDLLMASGINTDENILWWRYDGTTWSDYVLEQFGNNNQDTANLFDWVHLSPMPRTNRIAFVGIGNDYPDANSAAIHGAIWDGDNDTWIEGSNAILSFPTGNTQNYHATDAADVKFTLGGQNHGEAVAVWGNKQYVYASVWNETTGWSSNKTVANFGANKTVRWVRLEANPKSDDMIVAIAYQDGSNTNGILATVAYDGTARTFAASPVQHTTDLYGDVTVNRPFDLSWDPISCANCAMLVYSVGAPVGGSNLLYARTSSGGVGFDSPNGISAHQAHWVQVEREPRHDLKLRLAIQTDELRVWSWNGFAPWFEETALAIAATTEYGTNHNIQPMALAEAPLWGEPASGTTPVRLAGFTAAAYDASVLLEWETASELDNLGFHLYRGASADGPWVRLTASLIPGLGSSPEGRSYRYVDSGLENGTTYFYRLEDVDRAGVATAHGPVSATPVAGESVPGEPPPPPSPAPLPGGAWVSHGNPAEVELNVLERTDEGVTFELLTGGFYAQEQADGTSRLHVPGFFSRIEPGLPSVPTRRLWTEAVVGRGVRLVSVTPDERQVFTGLRPAIAGAPTAVAAADGTYQAAFRPVRPASLGRGLYPAEPAQVLGTAFQGEAKMAHVELSPLRVDAAGRVILARRLVIRVAFDGAVAGETGERSTGRRPLPAADGAGTPLARFATRGRGLHAVAFEDVPGTGGSAIPVSGLRLTRLGTQVAFHVEPRTGAFGPGSLLYFVAEGTDGAHGREAVYEFALAVDGVRMGVDVAAARGGGSAAPAVTHLRHEAAFEQDVNYLPALLESRDLWTWDYGLAGGQSASYPFKIQDLTLVPEAARLVVDLEGGSDTITDPDHHVRVFVNGSLVGEATWDGMRPATVEVDVPVAVLRPGDNALLLENAGDTGSVQSFVYLDRFAIEYPREIVPVDGVVEGVAPSSGRVGREAAPGTILLDVTSPVPAWLGRVHALGQAGYRAEAGHRYLMVAPEAVARPEVRPAPATTLRRASNQADWLLIGPRDLLPAAEPLVAHRQAQGLSARAVALEDVVDEFGHGESGPHAVRSFLAFAFQGWARPSPRYVVLLGDATYDPKGRLTGTSRPDVLPAPLTRSTFLWTASDPAYAATNGEDLLPDLALGRLSAATLAEAQAAVQKILDFETAGLALDGKAVLVADNPDSAGDFEANQDDVASILGSRPVERIYLGQAASPAVAKAAVMAAFNAGASLVSYVGHGSSGLWATEGLLRSPDVAALAPQARQPLVLTMTCSNGYFLSPYSNSLSERLALTSGKGAIAVFSPSGLSLNDAAHVYHRALARELEGGGHERLGDLVLAAQAAYAQTGAFPELLAIYHLFGDPGLRVR